MIVCLALRRGVLHLQIAQSLHQGIPEGQSRPVELLGKDIRRREPKLPPVDRRVQAMGQAVTLKTRGTILLGNDLRSLSGLQEGAQTKGMICMTMRVDHGMQRRLTPGARGGIDGLTGLGASWVDDQETGICAQRIRIAY